MAMDLTECSLDLVVLDSNTSYTQLQCLTTRQAAKVNLVMCAFPAINIENSDPVRFGFCTILACGQAHVGAKRARGVAESAKPSGEAARREGFLAPLHHTPSHRIASLRHLRV